jgi:hypothetical protein|tara:strand:- start:889 stop:1101 length:213 start_codon:yes stop_codon:yes gene_type:complete
MIFFGPLRRIDLPEKQEARPGVPARAPLIARAAVVSRIAIAQPHRATRLSVLLTAPPADAQSTSPQGSCI